ncbi:MAG: hypothetical protein RLZZ432_904 [Chloroflexota bacterium]|jgi:hypothetical protein
MDLDGSGDFGGDDGFGGGDAGHDAGPLDLNHNGSLTDEFILFALLSENANGRRRAAPGGRPRGGCGCLIPATILPLALALLLLV